jgi:uncharacterized protein (TIGR02246 family)
MLLHSGGTTIYAIRASLIGLVLLTSAALAQDKATIEKLNERFVAALNKRDVAAIGQMYAEDAYLLPAGAEMVKGRSAIQAFWAKAVEGVADFKLTTVDVKPLGTDAAREIGTYSLKTKDQQEVAGKYVVVWQKAGDEWKLATDIWNTDQ